ncbi:hypothetical protein B0T18DRAFT_433801 [Schizothecium vesticola]|uniref:DUF1996 domain-containing protein n=1 Tax=Schizothecium vesticola TaxID=314040 RepID=A0AA40F7V6_9PEZI|nr:hypothetical protein B0T18DRAFT_433801 [Schizothecium vesticola]
MLWKTLVLSLLLEQGVSQRTPPPGRVTPPPGVPAMLRFQCSQLVIDRLDPLVSPGSVPSPHLHQIVGGNSFKPSMDFATHDLVNASTCTSCTFTEDLSNYWTAVMYFKARNGTYKRVPQLPNEGLTGKGGITVYYIPPYDGVTRVTAFKPGFRMLVGDVMLDKGPGKEQKVCHRCMPKAGDAGHLNCASPDGLDMPAGFCEGGIRSIHTFPTCWDGKTLDAPDHRSHMAYPDGNVYPYGTCPESHPVMVPQLMLEIIWDTTQFNDPDLWPEDKSQPFVWSTGDKEGYTQHGDYVFGWKGDSLQRAMDSRCTNDWCEALEYQETAEADKCTIPQAVVEPVDGWLHRLPGIEKAV